MDSGPIVFSYSADETSCTAVAVWSGASEDVDYATAIELLEQMDRAAVSRGAALVQMVYIAPGYKPPSPVWRKRISEVNAKLQTSQYCFALVTESAVIRGIYTAVRWLIGARTGHASGAFRTFDQAADWVRHATGSACPQLEFHYARALAAANLTAHQTGALGRDP